MRVVRQRAEVERELEVQQALQAAVDAVHDRPDDFCWWDRQLTDTGSDNGDDEQSNGQAGQQTCGPQTSHGV
ncbi:hypothetical protein GCM10028799_64530 [Kribbella italica]